MKNILYTIILCFLFSFSVFADFQAGLDAHQTGDYETAFREFKVAAEQGDVYAQNNLGYMYQNGQGVAQDYKEAVKWYRLAGEQGNTKAQFNLGGMYVKGQGVTQDYKEAVKWWRLAAEQGYASAQFNLGGVYGEGISVIQNYVISHMWFNIAASNGSEAAKRGRDQLVNELTSEQIAEAQKLARECTKKNYKDCG